MKRLLTLGIGALALAACDTYAPGDPYGAPLPPSDPYGTPFPGPYPAPDQPLPGGPLPPGAPLPPAPGSEQDCPISRNGQWTAFVDTMPGPGAGSMPALVVTGTVVTATGGYRAEFDPYLQTEPGQPGRLVARLRLNRTGAVASQAATTHDVRWQWPLQGPIGSLTLLCGDRTLAQIAPVPAAR